MCLFFNQICENKLENSEICENYSLLTQFHGCAEKVPRSTTVTASHMQKMMIDEYCALSYFRDKVGLKRAR